MQDVPLVQLSSISKQYGGVRALIDIDWEVRTGEVHCLVGENGCGKSTLIKTVAGTTAPTTGRIAIDGKEVERLTPSEAKALGIQVIFQDLSLFPNLTVAENIAIDLHSGGYLKVVGQARMVALATEILRRLNFRLDPFELVENLTTAERQVVAICRGLAAKARLLFMDEPTASLTRVEVDRLLSIVSQLKAEGISTVFVSHRLNEVMEVADRVTVMRDGRKIGTWPAADMTQSKMINLMTGVDIAQAVVAQDKSSAEILLSVDRLTRKGEFEDVSFDVRSGEVVGITGLLGAGRTELALCLFGMKRPDRGSIRLRGNALTLKNNRDAVRAGIAYLPEDRLALGAILNQSIRDNIVLSILGKLCNRLGLIVARRRDEVADQMVRKLAIKVSDVTNAVYSLSGGNQQRVVLAKWLATQPRLLILDSPTVGVDIKNKQGIYDIVAQLAAEGVGIIVISDEVGEVFATCDRVIHMRHGRFVDTVVPGQISIQEMEERIYV